MSESNKVKESTQNTDTAVVEEESSPLYYFYSVGCGFCKKVDPIVDELIKEGHDILKLDMSDPENAKINKELQQEYQVQCGTPWFINADTGKSVCGYREKDILDKWVNGEDIPAPPMPKGQMPRPPFHGAPKKEVDTWKKEYAKWTEKNSHMPKLQTAEEILEKPRPKSQPPMPPQGNMMSDGEAVKKWSKEWDKWKKENSHLPNLQDSGTIIEQLRKRQQAAPSQPPIPQVDNTKINTLEAKVTSLEVKIDKIMSHFGVK
jgi:thiol-disulfide isomerase/thioredoxin